MFPIGRGLRSQNAALIGIAVNLQAHLRLIPQEKATDVCKRNFVSQHLAGIGVFRLNVQLFLHNGVPPGQKYSPACALDNSAAKSQSKIQPISYNTEIL